MLNLIDQQDILKGLDDTALQREMAQPSGGAPPFLVLSEISRRKDMRQRYAGELAMKAPPTTVAQDVLSAPAMPGMGPMGAPPPGGGGLAAAAQMGGDMPSPMPTPPGGPGFASGGIVAAADPSVLDYDSLAKRYQSDLDSLPQDRNQAAALALLATGAGILGGGHSNLGQNLGAGISAGIGSYTDALKTTDARETGALRGLSDLAANQHSDALQRLQMAQEPAAVREFKAFQQMSPEDKQQYLLLNQPAAAAMNANATATNDLPLVTVDDKGRPDPATQQQFLSSLDPQTASLIKQITSYQAPIEKVTSLRGGERQKLAALAAQYDPSFDMSQYGARAAMRKSVTSGSYSQALNAANLVIAHLNSLQNASDELHNTGIPLVNAGINSVKQGFGNPSVTKFNTIADAAANELAKVFKGVGSTDMKSIEEWRHNLDPNSSPEQIRAAINTAITDLLKSRIDTIQTQYNSAMGHPADFQYFTPKAKEILQKLGVDVGAVDPNAVDDAANAPADSGPVDYKTKYGLD